MPEHTRIRARQVVVAVAFCAFASGARAQTVVNTCGQSVAGSGILTTDLDCTGHPDHAVVLAKGAKFDLAGFTLTGGDREGVRCDGTCTVISSAAQQGVITGALEHGIANDNILFRPAMITVRNMRIEYNGGSGVYARSRSSAKARVEDSSVSHNGGCGVAAVDKIAIARSTVSNNSLCGVGGSIRSKVLSSTVDGNGAVGIEAFSLVCRDSTFSGNGSDGIDAFFQGDVGARGRLRNCSANGNVGHGMDVRHLSFGRLTVKGGSMNGNGGDGISISAGFGDKGSVRLSDLQISGNVGHGVRGGPDRWHTRLQLRDATITGNGGSGISGRFDEKGMDLRSTTVAGNGLHGIEHRADGMSGAGLCAVSLRDSTVTGNGIDAACGVSQTCADVATCEPPTIISSTCSTDYDTESGFPGTSWGVCEP